MVRNEKWEPYGDGSGSVLWFISGLHCYMETRIIQNFRLAHIRRRTLIIDWLFIQRFKATRFNQCLNLARKSILSQAMLSPQCAPLVKVCIIFMYGVFFCLLVCCFGRGFQPSRFWAEVEHSIPSSLQKACYHGHASMLTAWGLFKTFSHSLIRTFKCEWLAASCLHTFHMASKSI